MKKYFRVGLIAVTALMLGATMSLAGARDEMFVVSFPDVQLGELYNRNQIQAQDPNPRPSQLPAPTDPDNGNGGMGSGVSKAGPTMFDGFKSDMGGLAPNVGVRSGGMMSAKQQADRQITKLIRQLN